MEKLGSSRTLTYADSTILTTSSIGDFKESIVFISETLPYLPYMLVVSIFSYLEPTDLVKCLLINKSMGSVALDADLWQIHCLRNNVPCGPGIELLWDRADGHRGRWWKEIYAEWSVSRRNWREGHYRKRLVSVLNEKDAITW